MSHNPARAHFLPLLLFAGGTLLLGHLVSGLSFYCFPMDRVYAYTPPIYPPIWVFGAIWTLLYPCIGMAMGHIWKVRTEYDVRPVWAAFGIFLSANLLFVPIMALSNGHPGIMTLMDLNGVVATLLLAWMCTYYSKKAFYWLLPLVIWMPITTAIKIWLWSGNPT